MADLMIKAFLKVSIFAKQLCGLSSFNAQMSMKNVTTTLDSKPNHRSDNCIDHVHCEFNLTRRREYQR